MGRLTTRLLPGLFGFGLPAPAIDPGLGLVDQATGLLERDGFLPALAGDLRGSPDAARIGLKERWPWGRSPGGGVRGALSLLVLPTPSP